VVLGFDFEEWGAVLKDQISTNNIVDLVPIEHFFVSYLLIEIICLSGS
jgi:hypothetical protein